MSAVFGFNQVASIAAWSVLVFWQFSKRTGGTKDKSWYEDNKPWYGPPAAAFPIVWTLLYAALVVAMFYFTQNTPADSWQLITGVVLFIFHIYWNKMWSVYFWDMNDPDTALNVLLFPMLISGIALMIVFIVNQTGLFWVSVMLLGVYLLWLLYATVLNIYWVDKKLETMSPDERDEYMKKRRKFWANRARQRLTREKNV